MRSYKPLQALKLGGLNQGLYHPTCGFGLSCHSCGQVRGKLNASQEAELVRQLQEVPARMQEMLHKEGEVAGMARAIMNARDVLFLGRGSLFPLPWKGR